MKAYHTTSGRLFQRMGVAPESQQIEWMAKSEVPDDFISYIIKYEEASPLHFWD